MRQRPKADEGVRVAAGREAEGGIVEGASEHVIAGVASRVGARVRSRRVRRDNAAASTADEDGHRDGDGDRVPRTDALNSVIIESHAPTSGLSPRQNDCFLRVSKSAIATPCCSTQVK